MLSILTENQKAAYRIRGNATFTSHDEYLLQASRTQCLSDTAFTPAACPHLLRPESALTCTFIVKHASLSANTAFSIGKNNLISKKGQCANLKRNNQKKRVAMRYKKKQLITLIIN